MRERDTVTGIAPVSCCVRPPMGYRRRHAISRLEQPFACAAQARIKDACQTAHAYPPVAIALDSHTSTAATMRASLRSGGTNLGREKTSGVVGDQGSWSGGRG